MTIDLEPYCRTRQREFHRSLFPGRFALIKDHDHVDIFIGVEQSQSQPTEQRAPLDPREHLRASMAVIEIRGVPIQCQKRPKRYGDRVHSMVPSKKTTKLEEIATAPHPSEADRSSVVCCPAA